MKGLSQFISVKNLELLLQAIQLTRDIKLIGAPVSSRAESALYTTLDALDAWSLLGRISIEQQRTNSIHITFCSGDTWMIVVIRASASGPTARAMMNVGEVEKSHDHEVRAK